MEYDVIYADPCMKRMTPEFDGILWIRYILRCRGIFRDEITVAGCLVRCDPQ